ncbi:type II/IV secretion system ATPase subunit [Desulfurococcus mucosus]|uniref:Type II secretion system protein E n=1 Tax=Desulfurococcus mucosus (strain ATCC 35584 / DSM 2162 / JCM 9187 / O7/1) TaxID=765177 RepID=E8R8G6_DESM0|nr:type II/IV secretion system ATPase subunit [Desulfurococcus mucosus]ADV64792.1 type II secretion system protein E [Desulfurococcus mucosus DSM 2162]
MPAEGILAEYTVGAYRVRLYVDAGVYRYEATPLLDQRIVGLVESRLRDIVMLARRGMDLSDVIAGVLGVERTLVPEAVYAARTLLGYRVLQVLLDDPFVEDISVTGPGPIWVRHRLAASDPRVDFIETNLKVGSLEEVAELQQLIALKCGTYVSASRPIVDAQLPLEDGGHRVHIVSALTAPHRPEIAVRKKPRSPPSMTRLIEEGVLPASVAEYFRMLVEKGMSLIIAGPPGSGKTTLLRSILYSYIPLNWKIVIIEDTGEVDPPMGSAWARYTSAELGAVKVDLFDLAKAALRSSATRLIVVGETRGAEARVLVQAMLSGMGGLTTFHGGSPEEVVARLTSPPISLSPQQVAMFTAVAFMGFAEKPRRVVKRVSELIPGEGGVGYVDVWVRERDGLEAGLTDILKRSRRLGGGVAEH